MSKILFRIDKCEEYVQDVVLGPKLYICIGQYLWKKQDIGPDYWDKVDSTVYNVEDFEHIHRIYQTIKNLCFSYDFSMYMAYLHDLRMEMLKE